MTQRRLFSINKKQIKGENMFNAIKTKDEYLLHAANLFKLQPMPAFYPQIKVSLPE